MSRRLPHLSSGSLAVLLAAGACFVACTEEPPPAEEILRPVRWIEVSPTAAVRPLTYAGVAQAEEESRLSFRVSGTLSQLRVALGDTVSEGQVLARLDATDYELQVDQGAAGLAQAEAALRRAEADYDRVRSLYEHQNASKAELDAGRAAAESARAQVRAAQKSLDQARRQVAYTELKAPISGRIAALGAERNENVQAGQMVVLLTSLGSPEVRVAVPEVLVGQVQRGMSATIRFDALPEERLDGTISEVASASVGGSTFDVLVRVDGDPSGIRSGMAADVSFHLDDRGERRLVLPQLSVIEDSAGKTHVFVLEAGSGGETDGEATVRRRDVEVGELQAGGVEILSGLEPGSKVVTAGVRRLADGMNVRMAEAWGGNTP